MTPGFDRRPGALDVSIHYAIEDVPRRCRDLSELLDGAHCGVFARNAGRRITWVNHRVCTWLGYASDELVGQTMESLFPPELRERIDEEIGLAEAGDMRLRLVVLQRKDSSTFPALLIPHPIHDDTGRVLGGIGILVDLGAVQTAKTVGVAPANSLRGKLDQIALQIHALGLTADGSRPGLPLDHPELKELSARQREVLACLMDGDRVPTIAGKLHISPYTVRNHLKSMFRALGVGTQAELIERVRALKS